MRKKTLIFVVLYILWVPGVFAALALGVTYADRYVDTSSNPVPGWLMVVFLAVIIGGPAVVFSLTWNRPNRWQRALQTGGRQALARIVEVKDTGISSGGGLTIYVQLTLEVHPDGEAPFAAKLEVANSRVAIMHPGAMIPIRYDALDHKHVVFDDTPAAEPEIGSPWEQEPTYSAGQSQSVAEAMRMLQGLAGGNLSAGGNLKRGVYVMNREDGSLKAMQPADSDGAAGGDDLPAQLAQLDSLHRSGALTDAEYAAAKAKLLT